MSQVFAAVKAVIVRDGRFLAIKQQVGDKVFWDLPGGKIHFGEAPVETLKREVVEETGLEIKVLKPVGVWWFFRKVDEHQIVCTTFLCEPLGESVDLGKNPSKENIVEFQWVFKQDFLKQEYNVSHESLKQLIQELEL